MKNSTICRFSLIALTLVPFLAGNAQAARRQDVLVVPVRQRTVALALDVRAMRDLVLITYRGTASTGTPLMHIWSPAANAWQELAPESYAIGQFMPSQPGTLFLIGNDVPASVIEGAAQAAKVVRIDSVSISEIANTLNQNLKFTPREWTALAERHGMQTRDLNYERRKWGRFGPPPSERPEAEIPQESTVSPEVAVADPEVTAPVTSEVESTTPATIKPEVVAPIVLDASAGAPLAPEAAVSPSANEAPVAPVIEGKKSVPEVALPTIDELLPENK